MVAIIRKRTDGSPTNPIWAKDMGMDTIGVVTPAEGDYDDKHTYAGKTMLRTYGGLVCLEYPSTIWLDFPLPHFHVRLLNDDEEVVLRP